MSQFKAGQRVDQPSGDASLQELFERVGRLERARALGYYFDDRALTADTTTVVFNTFPSDLNVLVLSWFAWATGADVGLAFANFNDTFDAPGAEYYWNLGIVNQLGSQGSRNEDFTKDGGGFAYVPTDSGSTWGQILFPNYNGAFDVVRGPEFHGDGAWAENSAGGGRVDHWLTACYKQEDLEPLTDLEISVRKLSDPTTALQFAAGSRFTLFGF